MASIRSKWQMRGAPTWRGLEPLEARLLLSAVEGTAFRDLDRDGIQDTGEPGLRGVTVELFQTSQLLPDKGLEPNQVLVIYNSTHDDGLAVFDHYRSRRPGVLGFDLNDPTLTPGNISRAGFQSKVRDPIRAHLATNALEQQVVVLVLTKGLPHRIRNLAGTPNAGDAPADATALFEEGNATYASVDSDLTLLWQDLGDQPGSGEGGGVMDSFADNLITNPYYGQLKSITDHGRSNITKPFTFRNRDDLLWTWRSSRSGAKASDAGRIYLTTRLDGATVEDILAMINRAQNPVYNPVTDRIILDAFPPADFDEGDYAATAVVLAAESYTAVTHDTTTDFLIGTTGSVADPNATAVAGSVAVLSSYGGNHAASNTDNKQNGFVRTFEGQLVDGAIINTLESFNGRSFGGIGGFLDQGQLTEWVEAGGTFGIGNVYEPFSGTLADNAILLNNYLFEGLSWAEAAWSSIPFLSWQQLVIGDPLAVASFRNGTTRTTDANGDFSFAGLDSGSYVARFAAPGDFAISPADQGENDSLDSDPDPATGKTAVFRLSVRRTDDTIDVGVFEQADTPLLTVQNAFGAEDVPILLDIAAATTDTDGSEVVSILIGEVPPGAAFSAGSENGDGTWTISADQLDDLSFLPPLHSDLDLLLTVTAVATEPSSGDSAESVDTLSVTIDAVADPPIIAVANAAGERDTAIVLDVDVTAVDGDGSESLSIRVTDVPEGASLSAGTANGNGNWTLSPSDLEGLTIAPPAGSLDPFTLEVTATSAEDANGDAASTGTTLNVVVFSRHTLTGATEDEDFTTGHDTLLTGASAAGVTGTPVTFTVESVGSGTLTKDGNPIAAGTTTIVTGQQLTWRPPENANGTLDAFRILATDTAVSASVQFDVSVAADNDAPVTGSLHADREIVGAGDRLVFTASGVTDIDDTSATVRFFLDTDSNGTVDPQDTLLGKADGPTGPDSEFTIDTAIADFMLGPNQVLARARDPEGLPGPPASLEIIVTPVIGGPAEQDALSKKRKKIIDPFTADDGSRRPVTVSLSGPGTVEVLVAAQGEDEVRHIIVRNSDDSSSLSIRGQTHVDEVLVFSGLKTLDARDSELRGGLEVAKGIARIRFRRVAENLLIRIGDSDVATKMTFDEVVDLKIVSHSSIGLLSAGTWEGGGGAADTITARSLGKLMIDGDFPANLVLDSSLGKATIRGAVSGTWQVGADAGKISVESIAPGWTANFAGHVRSLKVKNDAAGDITALSIGSIRIKGNYDGGDAGASLRLTQPVNVDNSSSLGRLKVKGLIRNLDLRAAGHIGSATATAIEGSNIFAGVDDNVFSLPEAGDLVAPARLERLKIRGNRKLDFWFQDTRIAATEIEQASLGFARTDNGLDPFGIATTVFGSLTYQDAAGKVRSRTPQEVAARFPIGDLAVRVV